MRWCWRGPEPTGWLAPSKDGLSPTSANINPELNTEIHPAPTTPTLNADGTNNRAEANPNPFASNLFQDPAASENTSNLPSNAEGIADLLNSAGQNLRTG